MKATKASAARAAPVSRRAAGVSRLLVTGLAVISMVIPAAPGAVLAQEPSLAGPRMTEDESATTDGTGRTYGVRDSWSFGLGGTYFSTGNGDNGEDVSDDAAGSASLEQWMVDSVLSHWSLVLRGEALNVFRSGHIHPMSFVERWAGGAASAGYNLITGADDQQACRLLLEDFEPSPSLGTKQEVLAGFLTRPAACQKLWAAATAWEQTLDEIGALPGGGMSGLDEQVTDPILHAVYNAPDTVYSWAGEYPLEGPALLAAVLWQGSGLGSNDGGDGFAAVYYGSADEPGAPPYCGHIPSGVADDKVLVPAPCPLPPSLDSCTASAVTEEATGAGEAANDEHEAAPADGSFDVPHCSAVTEAEEDLPTSADATTEIRYEWTERWWSPDGHPAGPSGRSQSEGVEDAGNCERPTGADGRWVLSLCADEFHITYSVAGANGGVEVLRAIAPVKRNVAQASWSWAAPPSRPRFGALLAGVMPPSGDGSAQLVSFDDSDSEEQSGRAFAAAAEGGWRPPEGFNRAELLEFVVSRGEACPALWQALAVGAEDGNDDENENEDPAGLCAPPDRERLESWGWNRAPVSLDCNVPRSRLSESEARKLEENWVYVSEAPLHGSDAPHRPFLVDACMVAATMALFELADSHGIELRVSTAARTWDKQLELRRENCPAEWSHHQLLNEPAKRCNPHTAVPGKSRHNLGLAIDFNCDSFDHPCYRWLAEHATRLGFYELTRASNEPWHWMAAPPLPLH